MAGALLAFLIALIGGGLLWLVLGVRFQFRPQPGANAVLNLAAYGALVLPFAFVLVFFVLERL